MLSRIHSGSMFAGCVANQTDIMDTSTEVGVYRECFECFSYRQCEGSLSIFALRVEL